MTVLATPHRHDYPTDDPEVGTWIRCRCGKYLCYELTPYETLPMYVWVQYPKWLAKWKIRKIARVAAKVAKA